jgi:hypothetical protein
MFKIQNAPSTRLRNHSRFNKSSLLKLATASIVVCIVLLSFTTSFWNSLLLPHFSKPNAKAAAPLIRRIDIPYFSTAVPFNQTAIFWFGDVTSTDTYTDVRMGYNNTELYIDLRVYDRFLWYDTNTSAPDVTKGDNASIYLNTTTNGSSALDQQSYKFQAAVEGYVQRNNYLKAYSGSGTVWTAASIPFTTDYGWRGHGFNGPEDLGWSMTYHIPFSSLGLSGPPSQGTFWKLGVKVHNQDNAANTPLPEKWWPETASETIPSSWGQLDFGIPTYQAPQTSNDTTYTVRNKLNNQVVTDGMVGGSLSCGHGLNRWTQWGGKTYPAAVHLNIQNESDISDWNCFSKIYITFPLSSLPTGKGVANARVTLYEYGNSGIQGQPNPSYIQVATVNEDWNPATLSWNQAPFVKENITSILVNTKSKPVLPPPGLAITWDVSKAVAEAYATGQPLRLVFYSTDNQYQTGKYFTSSYVADWDANARPTLQATLGGIV